MLSDRQADTASTNSLGVHRRDTTREQSRRVIGVARLRSTHPWVRVRTVIFADDTIGVGTDGEPARVEQDVVVTAIIPARDGGVLVMLRSFEQDQQH